MNKPKHNPKRQQRTRRIFEPNYDPYTGLFIGTVLVTDSNPALSLHNAALFSMSLSHKF